MSKYRWPRNDKEAQKILSQVLKLAGTNAIEHFDAISSVQRVEMKVNLASVGEFVFLAILANGQCYEGRLRQNEKEVTWCDALEYSCMHFATMRSPIEFGITING